jgi:ATP-dependent DNA helicase RecG
VNSIKFDNRFRSAEFILKITVPKVAEKVAEKLTENGNVTENYRLDKGGSLISTSKMAEIIGVDRRNIARNIKKLQDQGVVRRVGPDKGGFWEIIV